MAIQVNINRESWPLESEFRISRGSRKVSEVITVSISEENSQAAVSAFLMHVTMKRWIVLKNRYLGSSLN